MKTPKTHIKGASGTLCGRYDGAGTIIVRPSAATCKTCCKAIGEEYNRPEVACKGSPVALETACKGCTAPVGPAVPHTCEPASLPDPWAGTVALLGFVACDACGGARQPGAACGHCQAVAPELPAVPLETAQPCGHPFVHQESVEDEDIRTKGSCDYCRGTTNQGAV